ncbi:MAG: lysylphosphatidylglycerol synthase domain-containing protein [Bacteroidia bacterium]
MSILINKRFYKVISLFIKATIFLLSFFYIYHKLISSSYKEAFQYILITNSIIYYFVLILILMFINWGLEARKWQLLIKPYEHISFFKSLKSIFSGVTISIFTPNRVGEFAGRIFYLKEANKIQASVKCFIGSASQLLITVMAGIVALVMDYHKQYNSLPFPNTINYQNIVYALVISILIVALLLFFLYKKRNVFLINLKSLIKEALVVEKKILLLVLLLSLLRYGIFTIQYYLILIFLQVNIDFITAAMLIAIVFFITAAIPTFALTEIVVRGAVAVSVFSLIEVDTFIIVSASLLLWIINLALPALIGSVFVWKLKFFKQ